MPNPDPLDALTPSELRRLSTTLLAGGMNGMLWELDRERLAALCEAVAKAQEAVDPGDEMTVTASSFPPGSFRSQIGFDWCCVDAPTLAAALGAVGAQEEYNVP